MFICPCGAFYIGKTRREFRIRMREHIYAANIGDLDSPIGLHMVRIHKYKTTAFKFIDLDRVYPNPRGGDWDRPILQLEAKWIFKLNASDSKLGLNDQICYKPFL